MCIFRIADVHLGQPTPMLKGPYRRCDIGDSTSAIAHRRYKRIADVVSPMYIADVASFYIFFPPHSFQSPPATCHHGQRLQCRRAPRHRTLAAPMAARPRLRGAAASAGLATSAGVWRRERERRRRRRLADVGLLKRGALAAQRARARVAARANKKNDAPL